jgi:hypothetical protein
VAGCTRTVCGAIFTRSNKKHEKPRIVTHASIGGGLVQGLVEENGTTTVLAEALSGQQQVAVAATVLHDVLDAESLQASTAGGAGLVHSEDSLAGHGHLGHGLEELISVLGLRLDVSGGDGDNWNGDYRTDG